MSPPKAMRPRRDVVTMGGQTFNVVADPTVPRDRVFVIPPAQWIDHVNRVRAANAARGRR